MRSIRRSLLFNLLLLLVLTLGLVVGIADRITSASIREKQQASLELIELQYRDKSDEALLAQAHQVARETQSQFNVNRLRNQFLGTQLQAITSPAGQYGFLPITVQICETVGNPMSWWLHARLATEIKLNEDDIYREMDSPTHEFVQLNSDWGASWLSKSLEGHSLPVDMASMETDGLYQSRFDTLELPQNRTVRRVIVKVPVTRFGRIGNFPTQPRPRFEEQPRQRFDDSPKPSRAITGLATHARVPGRKGGEGMFGPNSGPPGPPPGPPPGGGGPPAEPRSVNLPTIYIHVAWDLTNPHPVILAHQIERDGRLAEIDLETKTTLAQLRTRLAWITGVALFVALAGGWVLVGLGLAPLKRLSHAVSEITTKDFRVPIEPSAMPSEVRPVLDRLTLTLSELQKAFEREKRAAADISHELRTPLAAMTTTLEVACRKPRSAGEYRNTIEDCRGITRQMNQLVERMLALAWLDTGADVVRNETVEVGELVDGCVTIGKPLADVQGVTVLVNKPARLTMVTDPGKLREVIMNLVHNAIEYNQPGGEVKVSAERMADGGVSLEVADTGIGMTPEIREKIFERFFRADPSRHATGVHAGLGLAIVKEYVNCLGGSLHVESEPGRGSKFRVELPKVSSTA